MTSHEVYLIRKRSSCRNSCKLQSLTMGMLMSISKFTSLMFIMRAHRHTCTHTSTHTCTHTYTHIYTHTYTHIYTCIHTYVHTQTYTHIHIHTYTHIYRGEAIMLVKLSIILFSNSHNFAYYAHRFYLLFSKLCLVYSSWNFRQLIIYY